MTTTGTTSTVAAPLAKIFAINDGFMATALKDITVPEMWQRPADCGNPMFWLLGHIVHTRGAALRILGVNYRTGWGDRFQRGAVVQDQGAYPALDEVLRVRDDVAATIQSTLAAVAEADLLRAPSGPPLAGNPATVADQIAFLALHDSYHVGQLAYVRRLIGHGGIIG